MAASDFLKNCVNGRGPKSFKTRVGLYAHVKKRHRVKTFRRKSCAIQYDPIEMTRLRAKVANTEIVTIVGKTHSLHQIDESTNHSIK